MAATSVSFQLIQSALAGNWERTDGVLSMYIYAPVIAGQKNAVEFTVPTDKGSAVSAWDYEVVDAEGGFWMHLTNRGTQLLQTYRIEALEKDNLLRLHSSDGYDLLFHPQKS